jgi:eukaryotic-like serine/threonine-protein kinase
VTAAADSGSLVGKVVLGRYRVMRHLADGGMGAIYLARNEGAAGFIRPVVVKVLLPNLVADRRMVEMFNREARIMATLRHPSIVSVIDFAEDGDMHVMVLDYVHGFHLGRWHRYVSKTRGPFPVEIASHVILQVLRALSYAHSLKAPDGQALNIVHRDVTPSNILIDVDGHTKLADFGIARMSTDKTEVGKRAIKGKFPYLAPELIDHAEPSAATDVYAVGVTLHEVLLGRNEFRGANVAAEIGRVIGHVPTRVCDLRADVSAELSDVIACALAKSPADRFKSAAEFADALASVQVVGENEAARRLAAMAGEDFHDPRMTQVLSMPSLDDLASTWNTPTPISSSEIHVHRPPPNEVGDGATEADEDFGESFDDTDLGIKQYPPASAPAQDTVAMSPRASAEAAAAARAALAQTAKAPALSPPAQAPLAPASSARRVPWGPIVMGLGLVAVGTIGIIALVKSGQKSEDPGAFVVVDQRARTDAGAPTEAPMTPPRTDAAVVAVAPDIDAGNARPDRPKPDHPETPKPTDTVKDLTRAFGKQMGKVHDCFEAHSADSAGTTELSVRFRVDTDGSVAEAELVPASLGSTALGTCLLGIARATRFGALEQPITFRVPLRARVRPE